MKEYYKYNGEVKFIVTKNERGLYDYQAQEYSKINDCWVNMAKMTNFTRTALQDWLEIFIDF